MTNPDNAVGTNGAFGGRTSVNALNDIAAVFSSRGVVSGWACVPSTGMTVALGGDGETRDVAIAEDNVGNRTTINNISGTAINVTLAAAPSANSRIDSLVAYVANPPQGSATVIDNPSAVGLIAVSGTVAASPSAPTDAQIRSAITADGAVGSNAYYVVLANILIGAGTSTIVANNINAGNSAIVANSKLYAPGTQTLQNIGNISTSGAITITATGFLIGKAVSTAGGAICVIQDSNSNDLAGISYANAAVTIPICIPVVAGNNLNAVITGDGAGGLQGLKVLNKIGA